MSKYYFVQFAAAYGEGAYGEAVYSCTSTSDPGCETTGAGTGTGGTGTGTGSGGLADTGVLVAMMVTLACLIVFVALVVRIVRRKPAVETVAADSPIEDRTSRR